jgi:3-isopropylmalate dehydrogenase
MSNFKIAVLPGDGVGKEVIEAAMLVLNAVDFKADYTYGDIGWEFWKKEGNPLPDRTIELLKVSDAALFGAITSKPKDEARKELDPSLKNKGYVYFSPIVRLRQEFDLYTNMRPCKAFKGNPLNYKDDIDLIVFRENTEGMYAGVEFYPLPDEVRYAFLNNSKKMERFKDIPENEIAVSTRIMTKDGCTRIIKAAFEYADKNKRKSVTVVEKPNVLRETGGLMVRIAREIAKDYPHIEYKEANIDAMTMWLVKNPENYDVLVAENLFGDIISDLSAQLVGGLGFAASGNMSKNFGVFEPTHGSAPKYAGQYKVNPIAAILASKIMLDFLGETDKAETVLKAVAEVIAEEKVRTYDMGGNNTTIEMAEEIVRKIKG